jgi:hypothetical protein
MAYNIYGENLRPGHCEVHPHVHEEYPCSVCISESNVNRSQIPPFDPTRDATIEEEVTLGVGDGTGQHFVKGDYESIKILQEKLLKMEKMYTKEQIKALFFKYYVDVVRVSIINGQHSVKLEDWIEENVK